MCYLSMCRYSNYVIALLAFILNLLSRVNFIDLGIYLMSIISNITKIICSILISLGKSNRILLLLFYFPLKVFAININSVSLGRKITAGLGSALYILINWLFDYVYRDYVKRNYRFIVGGKINLIMIKHRILIGLIFYIAIFLGIISSTCLWYVTQSSSTISNAIGMSVSYFISYLANIGWLSLGDLSVNGVNSNIGPLAWLSDHQIFISLLRSLCESTAFNTLSWATFNLWSLWDSIGLNNVYSFLIGLVVYCLSSFFQVWMEMAFQYPFLYGVIYNISFTMLCVSTNGIYYAIHYNAPMWVEIFLGIISGLSIILLPMEVYRIVTTYTLITRIKAMIYLYFLFLSFAYHTYFIFSFIGYLN